MSSGKVCGVSHMNWQCGFARYEGGRRDTNTGIERISIDQMTDSVYMAYMETGVFSTKCPKLEMVTTSHFTELPRTLTT